MPDDRFLHKRACHSGKVASLTDFEYRVWTTYLLCADDYGVMRLSAAALRSGNDAFEKKPAKVLDRAFQRLADIGLIRAFTHQGKSYAYQPDWQHWQHVRNPRSSVFPLPPLDHIESCEESTKLLFTTRLDFTGESPANSVSDAATVQQCSPRGGAGETANGKRLMANGSEIRERFDQFWASYPKKVGRGAAWRSWVKINPDAELTQTIIASVDRLKITPQWVKDGGQFIPHPSTFLNQERWTDQAVELPQISEKTARTMGAIYGD